MTTWTPRPALAAAVVFAAFAAACASEPGTAAPSADPTTTLAAPSASTAATVPPDIPELEWTEQLLGGATVDGTSYAGRDLVIWFYAPT